MSIEARYSNGDYLKANPDWDRQDSQWKSEIIAKMLLRHQISPLTIGEIGCGAGDVLRSMRITFPQAKLYGYDISPQLLDFWPERDPNHPDHGQINFSLSSVESITDHFDILMLLDVIEHVRDPFTFIERARECGEKFVFHIPLDLSGSSVCRQAPLVESRRNVGHLHFYTKDIALETLVDAGCRIIDWKYTGAYRTVRNPSLGRRAIDSFRNALAAYEKDLSVRILGGETLLVLAE